MDSCLQKKTSQGYWVSNLKNLTLGGIIQLSVTMSLK